MKVIHTDTHEEAVLKSCGLYHDHITTWYIGRTEDAPNELQEYLLMDSPYVFIYDD